MCEKPTYEELEAKLTIAQKYAKLGWWQFDIQADKITWSDEIYELSLPMTLIICSVSSSAMFLLPVPSVKKTSELKNVLKEAKRAQDLI